MALALLVAWAVDVRFGEPRSALHPVAWLGCVMAPVGAVLWPLPPIAAFVLGAVVWCAGAALLVGAAWAWQRLVLSWPWWAAVPALAVVLKPCFAWRMLHDEVAAVGVALGEGLEPARERLKRLVSRDVTQFGEDELRETAIETLAENLNDSVVAPLFWAAVAGLPGAVLYRYANTLDAMWGYRGRWEWAGKWAARADDALSWLPARLTALLLLLAPPWRGLRRESRQTPSPNGGWAMGAMALRLNVRLRKPGVYVLNGAAPSPTAAQFDDALRAARFAAWAALAIAAVAMGLPR